MTHFRSLVALLCLFMAATVAYAQAPDRDRDQDRIRIRDRERHRDRNQRRYTYSDDRPVEITRTMPIQIGLIGPTRRPSRWLGLSTNGKRSAETANILSVNILWGADQGALKGLEIGGLANVNRKYMKGIQLAGLANVTTHGPAYGVQVAGFANVNDGRSVGIAIAGLANVANEASNGLLLAGLANVSDGHTKGLAIAGIANVSDGDQNAISVAGIANVSDGNVYGAQLAGLSNVGHGDLRGLQVAGVANVFNGNGTGIQIGGVANVGSGGLTGFQIGGVANVTSGTISGMQVGGLANVASGAVNGVQISGLANVAPVVNGIQVGLVNVARELNGIPVGVLNYVEKRGYRHLAVWASDAFVANVALKTGVRYMHSIVVVGASPQQEPFRWGLGLGLGSEFDLASRWPMNIEAIAYKVHEKQVWTGGTNLLGQLRLTAGRRLGDGLVIFVGPVLNVQVSDRMNEDGTPAKGLAPYTLADTQSGGLRYQYWVGGVLGIRFRHFNFGSRYYDSDDDYRDND